jgi:fumarate hydratase class II
VTISFSLFNDGRDEPMAEFRTERDSLGEIEVPAGAYWGAQTQRAIHNFPITGLKQYQAFIWGMAAIKRAAAEVNSDLGLFEDVQIGDKSIPGQTIARAIIDAADDVMAGEHSDLGLVPATT